MAKIKVTAVFPIIVAVILSLGAKAETTKSDGHWVSTWSDAVHSPLPFPDLPASLVIENQTIRMIVRPTLGGERLRIRFSNGFGTTAVTVGAAHIALLSKGAQIIPESDRVLTFSGSTSVSIPPGAPMLSDPVDLKVPAFSEMAIAFTCQERPQLHRLISGLSTKPIFPGRGTSPRRWICRTPL